MSQKQKLLEKMRNNPAGDWQLADLQRVASHYGIGWRHDGGSHCIFSFASGELTVPAHRPIKPYYVRAFMRLIDGGE